MASYALINVCRQQAGHLTVHFSKVDTDDPDAALKAWDVRPGGGREDVRFAAPITPAGLERIAQQFCRPCEALADELEARMRAGSIDPSVASKLLPQLKNANHMCLDPSIITEVVHSVVMAGAGERAVGLAQDLNTWTACLFFFAKELPVRGSN